MKTGSFGGEGAQGDHGAAELGPLGQLQRDLLPRLQGQWDALLAELLHYATSVRVHFAEQVNFTKMQPPFPPVKSPSGRTPFR